VNHLRSLQPADGIRAFYDGRVEGYRFADDPNWVDDGALALGIASYAIVDGDEALIYDTHVSVEHAQSIRQALEAEGVRRFVVLLSHCHLDHVAGTAAFADCEVIATARTAERLSASRRAIEAGTLSGPPGIDPLVLPTRTFDDRMRLDVGRLRLEVIHVNIHSDDAAVVWMPEQRVLLAGDTMEDTVTFVAEPGGLDAHLVDLERLAGLAPYRILPNHGDPDIMAGGGYGEGLIGATQDYLRVLQRSRREPALHATPLTELVADSLAAGWITYFGPYEAVHEENLAAVASNTPTADP
jgi:glyoxylase-like metal-dependent hydrolase (beta-lactamase superfamily II)